MVGFRLKTNKASDCASDDLEIDIGLEENRPLYVANFFQV